MPCKIYVSDINKTFLLLGKGLNRRIALVLITNFHGGDKTMRHWIILALAVLLLFSGSAFAAFDATTFTRSLNVPTVVITTADYQQACAFFAWRGANDADFNNYVVRLTSNNSEFNMDVNTRNTWYNACTIVPGEWVKAVVYRVDGNADGYYLNTEPDANATVNPGTMAQSGLYLMYNVLVAIAGIVALVVLATVMAVLFKKTGFKFKF